MKLAIYDKDGNYTTILEGINNPLLVGNNLMFDGGQLADLTDNHILLNNEDEAPLLLSDAISLDKKSLIEKKKSPEEEIAERDKRISELEDALLTIMDLM
jgi:hypothetical protein